MGLMRLYRAHRACLQPPSLWNEPLLVCRIRRVPPPRLLAACSSPQALSFSKNVLPYPVGYQTPYPMPYPKVIRGIFVQEQTFVFVKRRDFQEIGVLNETFQDKPLIREGGYPNKPSDKAFLQGFALSLVYLRGSAKPYLTLFLQCFGLSGVYPVFFR